MVFKKGQKTRLGIKHSNKSKRKMSLAKLGIPNPKCSETKKRLYKEGKLKSWNKGLTKETNKKLKEAGEKVSIANKGKHYSPATEFKKGRILPKEIEEKRLKNIPRGKKHHLYRKHRTEETKKKIGMANSRPNPKCSETKKRLYKEGKLKTIFKKGKEHPYWKGGKSFEPYGIKFNKELKEQIRKRDDYTCQLCGITQKNFKRKLTIHHIDYNKKNNESSNFISLCNFCNSSVNFSREQWTKFFQKKIFQRML